MVGSACMLLNAVLAHGFAAAQKTGPRFDTCLQPGNAPEPSWMDLSNQISCRWPELHVVFGWFFNMVLCKLYAACIRYPMLIGAWPDRGQPRLPCRKSQNQSKPDLTPESVAAFAMRVSGCLPARYSIMRFGTPFSAQVQPTCPYWGRAGRIIACWKYGAHRYVGTFSNKIQSLYFTKPKLS